MRQAVNHTICFAFCNPLAIIIFLPRFLLILRQTHDEMENVKLATHIFERSRPSSLIDPYPITW